jgi:hypothetical protein
VRAYPFCLPSFGLPRVGLPDHGVRLRLDLGLSLLSFEDSEEHHEEKHLRTRPLGAEGPQRPRATHDILRPSLRTNLMASTGLANEKAERDAVTASPSQSPTPAQSELGREKGARTMEKGPQDGYSKEEDKFAVTTLDEMDDPKRMAYARKWIAVICIGSASLCATCASSIVCALSYSYEEIGH